MYLSEHKGAVVSCDVALLSDETYCIHSTLLGGELSGFCFVLHSLKGTAAYKPIDGKKKVGHLANRNISSLALHCFISHNSLGLEQLSS